MPPPVVAVAAIESICQTGKKAQNGFSKNSGKFCEKVVYFGQARHSSDEYGEEEEYGFGRVIVVPNKRKNLSHYEIEYDRSIHKDDAVVVRYETHLPNTKGVKALLKEAFARADEVEYRFGGPTKKRRSRATAPSVPVLKRGTILLSGILNENVNTERQVDQDGDEIESETDDGSNCDIEESAFMGD